MASARIPAHDYSVSELEEKKLYAVTYQYETKDGWFADTWNITERNNIVSAIEAVDKFCDGCLESGHWIAYEITNVNVIRR